MIEYPLLDRLKAEQETFAREALTKPGNRDAFEYGRAQGVYAGLERAREIAERLIKDKDDRDNDL